MQKPRHRLSTTLLCSLPALLALAQGPAAHAQDIKHDFILGAGVHSGQNKTALDPVKPVMDWAGITSVRQEVYWHRLELTKGNLKYPANLEEVERFVDYTLKKGGMPLLILDYGNKLYDDGDGVSSPEAIEAFTRYARFVAEHFKGRVKLYEVWNEWNIGMGSNKSPRNIRDVATYVNLLKATYKVVKAVDASNIVIGGSVAGVDTKWTEAFIDAGGLAHLDAFSAHPYVIWNPGSKPEHAIRWLDNAHQKMVDNQPKRNIPIYVTEIGWPNHEGKFSWTEDQTANFLIRFHIMARSRPYIKGVWWYELVNGGRGKDNKEKAFGLVDVDFKAKPALQAYQVVANLIANAVDIKTSVTSDFGGKVTWEAKMKDGSYCRGHWLTVGNVPIPYGVPSYKMRLSTLWGDPTVLDETPYVGCEAGKSVRLPAALSRD